MRNPPRAPIMGELASFQRGERRTELLSTTEQGDAGAVVEQGNSFTESEKSQCIVVSNQFWVEIHISLRG